MYRPVSLKTLLAAASIALLPTGAAFGHGEEIHAVGEKGNPSSVSRTVEVIMTDNAFDPAELHVQPGETVRFVVKNAGDFVHEFNIGDREMHMAHQDEMMTMMESGVLEVDKINHHMMGHGSGGMKHDDPNAVLLDPGATGEVIWTFPAGGQLQFACNVPGHYEAGMVGEIVIDGDSSS